MAVLSASPAAQASGGWLCAGSFPKKPWPLLSVGAGAGYSSYGGRPGGGYLGVEGSAGVFFESSCWWMGVYGDFVRHSDPRSRWSVGPEIGHAFLGMDAGYVNYGDDLGNAAGFRARGHLTLGFVGLHLGGGRLSNGVGGFFEAGVLLKFPALPLLLSL